MTDPLITFEEEDQVIEDANDTIFGLASSFFSTNIHTIDPVSNQLQYGMVGVNDTAISNSVTPFGWSQAFRLRTGKWHIRGRKYVETKLVAICTAK